MVLHHIPTLFGMNESLEMNKRISLKHKKPLKIFVI